MTLVLIVLALRLLIPFTIFRWPLLGGLLAFTADIYDFVILNKFGWPGFLNSDIYQPIDKALDVYYFSFEVFVAAKWSDVLARRTAVVLFLWRMIGIVIFELTGFRKALFLAPNIFEYFYLAFLGIKKINPAFRMQRKWLIIILAVIAVPKLIFEYILHFREYPLGIANSWEFVKKMLFR